MQSFFEDHSPARRQSLDTGWRNYPRPELHAISEKGRCAATSSRGGSCRRRPTDPRRLGRGATLPRCDVPQTPRIPQRTVALSPPGTHRFPRRGFYFSEAAGGFSVTPDSSPKGFLPLSVLPSFGIASAALGFVLAWPSAFANRLPIAIASAFSAAPNSGVALSCEAHRAENLPALVASFAHKAAVLFEQRVTLPQSEPH
jgi:hypothetical protein